MENCHTIFTSLRNITRINLVHGHVSTSHNCDPVLEFYQDDTLVFTLQFSSDHPNLTLELPKPSDIDLEK